MTYIEYFRSTADLDGLWNHTMKMRHKLWLPTWLMFVEPSFVSVHAHTLIFLFLQVDLIGLPSIITNLVLKRHPLAIHYLRQHLPPIQPPVDVPSSQHQPDTNKEKQHISHNNEPIALLSDVEQRLDKGWSVSGWTITT